MNIKHIKNFTSIKLFVACSFIYNMYGIDCKSTNPEYRKKNALGELREQVASTRRVT